MNGDDTEAEIAIIDITGVPTPFDKITSAAGDSVTPITTYPKGTRAVQVPDSLATSRFLDAFGRAERVQTCSCERTSDASVMSPAVPAKQWNHAVFMRTSCRLRTPRRIRCRYRRR